MGLLREARERLRAGGIPDDALEAEALARYVLGVDSAWLYGHHDAGVARLLWARFEDCLARRLRREPLAYITGTADFYGRRFMVDRRVLVPRPETEMLVDRALRFVRERGGIVRGAVGLQRIADIGTGSGVLAVTLALELPGAEVHAVDASTDALSIARANAEALGAGSRIEFNAGDLVAPLAGRFDVVVANLPYIRSGDLDGGVLQPELAFEPRAALDGGVDGLLYVRPLICGLPGVLQPGGIALLEIDPPVVKGAVEAAGVAMPGATINILRDLAGLERVVELRLA